MVILIPLASDKETAVSSVIDPAGQSFRVAMLACPFYSVRDYEERRGWPQTDMFAALVQGYVVVAQAQKPQSVIPFQYVLEEVIDAANKARRAITDALKRWNELCDAVEEPSFASVAAVHDDTVHAVAKAVGLPVELAAGRLSRMHGHLCPHIPHHEIPRRCWHLLVNGTMGIFL
jgi:hypothetical protein